MDPFVARAEDVAALERLHHTACLVTVTGVGGVGKTRLVTEWARDRPALWVSLRAEHSVEGLVLAVAGALQLAAAADHGATAERITEALRREKPLLVLDNVEQLAAGARKVLPQWMRETAIVCTSRIPLGVRGEEVLGLEPLPGDAASELFLRRSGVHAIPDNAVDELVTALGGIPLNIEIAAAHAGLASPRQLLERLRRTGDLVDSERDPGQSSLGAVLDATLALLDSQARRALAQICIFRGEFTSWMAEQVVEVEGDALGCLLRLHRSSLIRREVAGSDVLLHVPVPVAELVRRRWPAPPELASRYAVAMLSFAADLGLDLSGPDRMGAVTAVRRHSVDVQLALQIAIESAPEALQRVHDVRSLLASHLPVPRLIELDESLAPRLGQIEPIAAAELVVLHAAALRRDRRMREALVLLSSAREAADGVAELILLATEGYERALYSNEGPLLDDSRRAAEGLEALEAPDRVVCKAWRMLGTALRTHNRGEEGLVALERSLDLSRRIGDMVCEATVLCQFALTDSVQRAGEHEQYLRAALDVTERSGREAVLTGMVLGNTVFVRAWVGDYEGCAVVEEAVTLAIRRGDLDTAHRLQVQVAAAQTLVEPARARRQLEDLAVRGAPATAASLIHRLAIGFLDQLEGAPRRVRAVYAGLPASNTESYKTAMALDALAAAELGESGPNFDHGPWQPVVDAARAAWSGGSVEALERALAGVGRPNRAGLWIDRVARRALMPRQLRLEVANDGSWFHRDGDRTAMGRRKAARGVLAALARARVEHPGSILGIDDLVAAGWPGEQMRAESARRRVYTTVHDLRQLGLTDLLQTVGEGYRIDPGTATTLHISDALSRP